MWTAACGFGLVAVYEYPGSAGRGNPILHRPILSFRPVVAEPVEKTSPKRLLGSTLVPNDRMDLPRQLAAVPPLELPLCTHAQRAAARPCAEERR